jgi:Helix-turn-helix domain
MTILDEIRDVQRWNEQTKAVALCLEKYGSVYKHDCTRGEGLPGYGIIEHPGARIFDLREAGYEIRTDLRPTCWTLISMPKPKQLPLVS